MDLEARGERSRRAPAYKVRSQPWLTRSPVRAEVIHSQTEREATGRVGDRNPQRHAQDMGPASEGARSHRLFFFFFCFLFPRPWRSGEAPSLVPVPSPTPPLTPTPPGPPQPPWLFLLLRQLRSPVDRFPQAFGSVNSPAAEKTGRSSRPLGRQVRSGLRRFEGPERHRG